ncbi:unnamed protein product [Caenorhabditis sp. 36 PRJEB53466]|nr:unnamed protein product [Caenorhabditis sp. 36 PRJEB53466]
MTYLKSMHQILTGIKTEDDVELGALENQQSDHIPPEKQFVPVHVKKEQKPSREDLIFKRAFDLVRRTEQPANQVKRVHWEMDKNPSIRMHTNLMQPRGMQPNVAAYNTNSSAARVQYNMPQDRIISNPRASSVNTPQTGHGPVSNPRAGSYRIGNEERTSTVNKPQAKILSESHASVLKKSKAVAVENPQIKAVSKSMASATNEFKVPIGRAVRLRWRLGPAKREQSSAESSEIKSQKYTSDLAQRCKEMQDTLAKVIVISKLQSESRESSRDEMDSVVLNQLMGQEESAKKTETIKKIHNQTETEKSPTTSDKLEIRNFQSQKTSVPLVDKPLAGNISDTKKNIKLVKATKIPDDDAEVPQRNMDSHTAINPADDRVMKPLVHLIENDQLDNQSTEESAPTEPLRPREYNPIPVLITPNRQNVKYFDQNQRPPSILVPITFQFSHEETDKKLKSDGNNSKKNADLTKPVRIGDKRYICPVNTVVFGSKDNQMFTPLNHDWDIKQSDEVANYVPPQRSAVPYEWEDLNKNWEAKPERREYRQYSNLINHAEF